jgi:protein arginine kinase activator
MLCDFCHEREAVFFIEQVGPSSRRKLNICMECAVKRGITPDPQSLEKSVGGLFAELSNVSKQIAEEDTRVCPVCGTSLASIRKTNRLGCPECYSIFKKEIADMLKSVGQTGSYTGSMPRRLATFRSVLTDRIELQSKLETALKNEDYEKAAIYRDYLRAIEKSPVADDDSGAQNE